MDNIIVALHIGRGGRFNNPGHQSFIGEKNFQDIISLNSEHVFEENRDEKGRFCKLKLVDLNGDSVTDDDPNGLTGTLDFDGQYDTDIAVCIDDCSPETIEMIRNDTNIFKSSALQAYLDAH